MGYKYKPNKSVAKRFRVSKTGKVKRHHSFTSHLRSSRTSAKKRMLRGAAVLFEGHARNMRNMLALDGLHPNRTARDRRLAVKAAQKSETPSKK